MREPSPEALRAAASGAEPPMPALEVLSAHKTYPNGTIALQPVELTVQEGEFITLLGPSGCGKSTLLKMVAGLLPPTDGRLLLWRKPVQQLDETGRRMAFVFQSPTLMPWATVAANVRLPLDLAGVPRAQAEQRVQDALALVGLARFAAALPRNLSGGMQMRVSIARSLVVQPQLLLMDEPFGALDEITRHKLDAELLSLWREKKLTVIFVTHSIHEAVFLSTRVVMMAARPGRIVEEITIDEPYPRTPDFMVTPRFAQYARQLQDSLLRASQDTEEAL
ncbi:MAG TPA: ABC transporter ATP-binding protein [Ramlibacter sp.]|jgi:NitT/TauT family transport system ATP-binding protein|uniref:ABC transporter ATP-binding protein n=1 Tax=Ramlibacter sp. TaxID=1917967 RepID=UPI002D5F2E64|nr:ABC transporter ATP-binding protein [Ramlibacter sp.]HZY18262.1 ABC transporter ATP-binding protein [Ramlibacter sp.]